MNVSEIEASLAKAFSDYDYQSARSQQSRDGILGPSDIGFCRQRAALVTIGTEPTDKVSTAAAQIGTAIHNYAEAAIKRAFPDWILGSIDGTRVTASLPSGVAIGGTPDIIAPDLNAIIDIKTVDGFAWIKREGTSQNHKYQRHLYALGAIQNGLLDDSKDVYVGNWYIDRSGKEPTPLLLLEPMDHTLTNEIDSWAQDVIYAVKQGEDAARDVAPAVCERICQFFTACRGALDVLDGTERITDPTLLSAVDMYVEGRDLEKQAAAMKKEAQQVLLNVNGTTSDYQVRWVEVQPTKVEAFDKTGYMRMDVRKLRK